MKLAILIWDLIASGLQAGYATLDSIRAVQQSKNITGIDPKAITTLHGYSSGAQAVGWVRPTLFSQRSRTHMQIKATELHPTYAPELEIAGAAFGGLPANISALLEMRKNPLCKPEPNPKFTLTLHPAIYQKGERAFLGPPVVLGISKDYPQLSTWLDEALFPSRAEEYRIGDKRCVSGNHNFSNQDLGQYFKRGYDSIFEDVPLGVIRETGTMGVRGTPRIPWYIYHAAGDDVSPQNLTDKLVDTHCKHGANILVSPFPYHSSILLLTYTVREKPTLPQPPNGVYIWSLRRLQVATRPPRTQTHKNRMFCRQCIGRNTSGCCAVFVVEGRIECC